MENFESNLFYGIICILVLIEILHARKCCFQFEEDKMFHVSMLEKEDMNICCD